MKQLRKRPGVQGPIDDAFRDNFVVVLPGGKEWHPGTSKYIEASLERFTHEWSKYMRGDLRTKAAGEVTDADMRGQHLVLFGDPQSNPLIAKVLPQLPLTWTKDKLTFGGQDYDPRTHVPVMIYPNPLAPGKYIVLNSGHTFHAAEFQGTNAGLYPRLGDFAILRPDGKAPASAEVVRAGLFNEEWGVPE